MLSSICTKYLAEFKYFIFCRQFFFCVNKVSLEIKILDFAKKKLVLFKFEF